MDFANAYGEEIYHFISGGLRPFLIGPPGGIILGGHTHGLKFGIPKDICVRFCSCIGPINYTHSEIEIRCNNRPTYSEMQRDVPRHY